MTADWVLGTRPFDPEEFELEEGDAVPDLSLHPEECILSAFNASDLTRTYVITVEHRVRTALTATEATRNRECWTFVVVLRPRSIMDLCIIDFADDDEEPRISSDITDLEPETYTQTQTLARTSEDRACAEPELAYPLPLKGGPYMCSQGFGGCFTHFYPATAHAVDLECPVGTPIYAVGAGKVLSVQDANTCTGIHVKNLFSWNSIMLHLDDGTYVEYVHIETGSCRVQPGDRVQEGQQVCVSGNVGFCPTPHLHIQMHTSAGQDAPTVPFVFRTPSNTTFVPHAGAFYHSELGQVEPADP